MKYGMQAARLLRSQDDSDLHRGSLGSGFPHMCRRDRSPTGHRAHGAVPPRIAVSGGIGAGGGHAQQQQGAAGRGGAAAQATQEVPATFPRQQEIRREAQTVLQPKGRAKQAAWWQAQALQRRKAKRACRVEGPGVATHVSR